MNSLPPFERTTEQTTEAVRLALTETISLTAAFNEENCKLLHHVILKYHMKVIFDT